MRIEVFFSIYLHLIFLHLSLFSLLHISLLYLLAYLLIYLLAPALKKADIGIAVDGATEAAKAAGNPIYYILYPIQYINLSSVVAKTIVYPILLFPHSIN